MIKVQSISAQDALYKVRAALIQGGHISHRDSITMCWVVRLTAPCQDRHLGRANKKKKTGGPPAAEPRNKVEHKYRYVLQTTRPAGAYHALLPQGAEVAIFTEKAEEGATPYHSRNQRANNNSMDYTAMIMPRQWLDHKSEQDQWSTIEESTRKKDATATAHHERGGTAKSDDAETRRTTVGPFWDATRFPAGVMMTWQEAEIWTDAPIARIKSMKRSESSAWTLTLMTHLARKLARAPPRPANEEWRIQDFGQKNNTREMRESAREPTDWPARRLHPRANKGTHFMCDPDERTCAHCSRPPPDGQTQDQHLNQARALHRVEEQRAAPQILRAAKQGTWIGHMGQVDRNAPRVCTQTGGNQPHTIPQLARPGKGIRYAQTGLRWACPGCTRGQPKARMAVNWRCRRCKQADTTRKEEHVPSRQARTIEDETRMEKNKIMEQKRLKNEEDVLYEEYMSRREQTLRGGFPTIASTRHDDRNTLTEGCVVPTIAQHELQGGNIRIRIHIVDLWSGTTTTKRIEEFCAATSSLMARGHSVELTKLEVRGPHDPLHQKAATCAAVSAFAEARMRELGPSRWAELDMANAISTTPGNWLSRCNAELTRVLTERHRENGKRARRESQSLWHTHRALQLEQEHKYKDATANHREALALTALNHPWPSNRQLTLHRMENLTRASLLAGHLEEPKRIQAQIVRYLAGTRQENNEHAERLQTARKLQEAIGAPQGAHNHWSTKRDTLTRDARDRTKRAARNQREVVGPRPPSRFVTDPDHNRNGQVYLTDGELQILQNLGIEDERRRYTQAQEDEREKRSPQYTTPSVQAPISIDQLPTVIMEHTRQLASEVAPGEPERREGYLHVNGSDTRGRGTHYTCVGYEVSINTQHYTWSKEEDAWTTPHKRG